MGMFRRKADQIIDSAHSAIADAEMMLDHSFTDADKAIAGVQLSTAQDYLTRAISARNAWDMVEHDDYEEYPNIPRSVVA